MLATIKSTANTYPKLDESFFGVFDFIFIFAWGISSVNAKYLPILPQRSLYFKLFVPRRQRCQLRFFRYLFYIFPIVPAPKFPIGCTIRRLPPFFSFRQSCASNPAGSR